jgi:hypothetical protein
MIVIETRCRRHDWTEGFWLTLGDGQRWCLPSLTFTRKVISKPTGASITAECDHDVDVMAFTQLASKTEGIALQMFVYRYMFSKLLQANYDMTEAEAKSLLPFGIDGIDPGFGSGLVKEILDVVGEAIIGPVSKLVDQGGAIPGNN